MSECAGKGRRKSTARERELGPELSPRGWPVHRRGTQSRRAGVSGQASSTCGSRFQRSWLHGPPLGGEGATRAQQNLCTIGVLPTPLASYPHPLHACTEVSLVLPKTGACADPSDSTPASHCLDSPCFSLFLLPGPSLFLLLSITDILPPSLL